MRFEFATAAQIVFGPGAVQETASLAKGFGRSALLVTGQGGADPSRVLGQLNSQGFGVTSFEVPGEPTVDLVIRGAKIAREQGCEWVIAFGGGSVIDAGKAISALLTNPGDIYDYLEVIGKGQPIPNPAAPLVAIPTTAGTGAEVTRNAVLLSPQHRFKVSMRSPTMLPRVAIVDPELTYSLPPAVTASTGMDALTQLIEPFVSARANPIIDPICKEGIQRGARSLRKAFRSGQDAQAREDMSLASLMGGLALANAGLGAVHGFASPIGGMFPAPHGAVCARLLGPVMQANLTALRERAPRATGSGATRKSPGW